MKFIQNAKNPSKHKGLARRLKYIQRKSVPHVCGTQKQTPMHQKQTSTNKPKTLSN